MCMSTISDLVTKLLTPPTVSPVNRVGIPRGILNSFTLLHAYLLIGNACGDHPGMAGGR